MANSTRTKQMLMPKLIKSAYRDSSHFDCHIPLAWTCFTPASDNGSDVYILHPVTTATICQRFNAAGDKNQSDQRAAPRSATVRILHTWKTDCHRNGEVATDETAGRVGMDDDAFCDDP